MVSRYLLCALSAVSSVFALALSQIAHAQIPLLDSQQHAKPSHMGVLIAFKRSGEDHEATLQFPLGQPLKGTLPRIDVCLPF